MKRENVVAAITEMHDRKKASHLTSVARTFDWLDKHPVENIGGLDYVRIDEVQAVIVHMDFRHGGMIILQPASATGDIGNSPGGILTLYF